MPLPPPPPDEPVQPPPETGTPEPVQPGDPDPAACPRCGSGYAAGQEYCLECGLRLPIVRGFVVAQIIPSLGRSWKRHARWYPGDWIWPVLFGLIVATAAATVTILVKRDSDTAARTIIATGPTETTGTETVPPPTTETTGTETATTPTETTPTETTPTETTQAGPIKWPPGKTGFTIVLASVAQSDGLPSARKVAQKGIDAGLTDVGVLNSSNYSSLNSGYYVVFSGVHDTIAEAQADLSTAKSTFPQAYTRKIVP